MTSSLFGCTLSTNETNEAVKVSCLYLQGPLPTNVFSKYPDILWIHQSAGLTKLQDGNKMNLLH